MNYILGRDRLQASVECFKDYVESDSEVRVIDKIIDTLDIESLGFNSKELTSSYLLAPLRKSKNLPKVNTKVRHAEARRRWDI
jgi:hypothetical protein